MKNYIKITLLFLVLIVASCEDVIDVPLQKAATRLVVEASIDWEKGTTGNEQTIMLSNSSAFFDTTSNTEVTGASVIVTNDINGAAYVFADQNNGNYTTTSFVPVLGEAYTLEIIYEGETYTAKETLNAVPEITDVYQDVQDGFDDEVLEAHVIFTDPPEEGNNYLFKFQKQGELLPELELGDDEYVNGNEIDWWYELDDDDDTDKIEEFVPGDILNFDMYGISEAYGNYIEILINQIGGVGLFDTTPVSVKGNCINLTNPENYAHGYFRLTEFNRVSYTFE
jgi:hypothetical protein